MNARVRDWFVSWAVWRLRGKPPPRPKTAPLVIPLLAWRVLGWVTWKLGYVKTKPLIVGALDVQPWMDDAYRQIKDAVRPPSPVVVPVPVTGRSRTKGKNGLYFYTAANASIDIVKVAKEHNLWVALLVHETTRFVGAQNNPPGLREALQAEGVPVIATGWIEGADIEAETNVAAQASAGFDEYMANAENPRWGYSSGGDSFARSDAWCPRFRAKTGIVVSVCLEWGQAIHLAPWRAIEPDLVLRPQCYMNQYPHMTPSSAVDLLAQAQGDGPGLRPDQVEPTYGKWGDLNPPAEFYRAPHFAAKAKGVRSGNFWAGEFMTNPDCDTAASF